MKKVMREENGGVQKKEVATAADRSNITTKRLTICVCVRLTSLMPGVMVGAAMKTT
jgi:hypothetical protein